jgi:tetratricopeptide (TPR) repeat protein
MAPFPPVTNRALAILLAGAHRTGTDLAALVGLKPGTISSYISGWKPLSMEILLRFAGALGIETAAVQEALLLAARLGADAAAGGRPALVSELGRLVEELVEARLPRLIQEDDAAEDRRRAQKLWEGLKDLRAGDWRSVLSVLPAHVSWAVCERLAEQSAEAASDDANRALELAELALGAAARVPGEALRRRCEGYAWAFVGNARRVRSDLRGANEAFEQALRRWQEGAPEDPGFLDGSRLLDLEASLRIGERCLPEARALLAQAATQVPGGLPLARILIKDAYALELMGNYDSAVTALRRATPLIPGTEIRLHCVVQFNLLVNLCHLGRAAEAEPLLPRLRALAARIDYGLDQVRLRWLQGRIAAGLGRHQEAVEALAVVRAELAERTLRYDEALVSMELAEVYLVQGRTGDVKRLVRQMEPVFKNQGVHDEARKALGLFREAVEVESVTLGFVRCLISYLYRAQHDPDLQFQDNG